MVENKFKLCYNKNRGVIMELKSSRTYAVLDLINWNRSKELELNPKFQRNSVWDEQAKSFLIDSIIRDFPIPPIFIRQKIDLKNGKNIREVIDGQQRSRAIIGFYNGDFKLLKKHNAEYGGMKYEDLPDEIKEKFLKYTIFVDIITNSDDSIIYDIFARLNSNAAVVNNQEIRNAKFWGEFKVASYTLASQLRDFFIDYKIFSSRQMNRMLDVEFVSALYTLAIDGIQSENAKMIDKYYEKYDKNFDDMDRQSNSLLSCFEFINNIFINLNNNNSVFYNKTYLYDFIAAYLVVTNHITLNTDHNEFLDTSADFALIVNRVMDLEDELQIYTDNFKKSSTSKTEDGFEKNLIEYERFHRIHSTNKDEREMRVRYFIDRIFSK